MNTAQMNTPMLTEPLTGLEHELLGYVERLTTASEDCAARFEALEARSTGQIADRLATLELCVTSLFNCLNSLTNAFIQCATASNGSVTMPPSLTNAVSDLATIAQRLTRPAD